LGGGGGEGRGEGKRLECNPRARCSSARAARIRSRIGQLVKDRDTYEGKGEGGALYVFRFRLEDGGDPPVNRQILPSTSVPQEQKRELTFGTPPLPYLISSSSILGGREERSRIPYYFPNHSGALRDPIIVRVPFDARSFSLAIIIIWGRACFAERKEESKRQRERERERYSFSANPAFSSLSCSM